LPARGNERGLSPALGRQQFFKLGGRGIGEEVLLEMAPITEEEPRSPLVDDVSRKQIERSVNIIEAFAVKPPFLTFGSEALRPVKQAREVLRRRFAIPWLVIPTDDDVKIGPACLAEVAPPSFDDTV
jgi:hypothetical protein